jgi:DNA adenine methylase
MGSKNRIAKEIIPFLIESEPNNIYDLFCGGLNLSDAINSSDLFATKYNIYANDKNKYLIAMWQGLQQDFERPYKISRKLYSEARIEYNNKTNINFSDFEIGWIGWAASFNGRFFDGGYSGTTKTRNYISEQIRNIEKQIPLVKDFSFTNSDYFDVEILPNSVIYCDIPYKNTKQYTTSKNFDYDFFYNWCRIKAKQGFNVFISEYEMPAGFDVVWEKEIKSFMKPSRAVSKIERLFEYCG